MTYTQLQPVFKVEAALATLNDRFFTAQARSLRQLQCFAAVVIAMSQIIIITYTMIVTVIMCMSRVG